METAQATGKFALIYRIYRALVIPAFLYYGLMIFYVITRPEGDVVEYTWWTRLIIVFGIAPVTIGLGLLIMRRVPGNVVGPALIVFVCVSITEFVNTLLLPELQASLNMPLLGFGFVITFVIVLSHFPTGRVFPARIAKLFYAFVAATFISVIVTWLTDEWAYGFALDGSPLPNRFYVPVSAPYQTAIDWSVSFFLVIMTSSVALLVYRYIKTNQTERQQLRWLVFSITITFLALLPYLVFGPSMSNTSGAEGIRYILDNIVVILFMAAFPFGIGMGVLFYRLWDIDVIIRKTLVYSTASLVLILTYFGIVLLTQNLLGGFIPDDNALLIVASTLAVAALFNPVLRRVQRVIDRLFYRKRYDIELTLTSFQHSIQDTVAPEEIGAQVVQTIEQTLQPDRLSIWLVE